MDTLQEFAIHFVITVLMTPLLLFYAIPFLVLAWLFHRYASLWLTDRQRLLLACGIASLGIAPAYDAYRGPQPIYTWLLAGDDVGPLYMLVSFAITWLVVLVQARTLWRH